MAGRDSECRLLGNQGRGAGGSRDQYVGAGEGPARVQVRLSPASGRGPLTGPQVSAAVGCRCPHGRGTAPEQERRCPPRNWRRGEGRGREQFPFPAWTHGLVSLSTGVGEGRGGWGSGLGLWDLLGGFDRRGDGRGGRGTRCCPQGGSQIPNTGLGSSPFCPGLSPAARQPHAEHSTAHGRSKTLGSGLPRASPPPASPGSYCLPGTSSETLILVCLAQ